MQVCVEKDPACPSDRPHSPVCPPGGRQLLLCTDQLVPSYDSHKSFVYQEWLVNPYELIENVLIYLTTSLPLSRNKY